MNSIAPKELDDLIPKSQREEMFGGTAPNVTQFWPPRMPEMTEKINEKDLNCIPKEDYSKLI